MYCKYCGAQIADNSVFCSKCGKIVVDANSQGPSSPRNEAIIPNSSKDENSGWVSTKNLQWKKPLLVRIIQYLIIATALFWGIYSIVCLSNGGEVYRYFGERRTLENYSNPRDPHIQYEENLYVLDYWGIFKTKSTKWNEARTESYYRDGALYGGGVIPWAFSYEDIQSKKGDFRLKVVFLGIVPALIVLWLTMIWIKRKPFPQEKDGLPRDYADEIEQYEFFGFQSHKYVLFKKNGKYGIIDVAQYRVHIPAQYDTIAWRTYNKTYDALKNGGEKTYVIEDKKEQIISQKDIIVRKTIFVIGILLALCTIYLVIGILINIHDVNNFGVKPHNLVLISILFGLGSYVCINNSLKK